MAYTYTLTIEGNEIDFNPVNSGEIRCAFTSLEFPFHAKTKKLEEPLKFTKASVSTQAWSAIESYLLKSNKTICYFNIYDNGVLFHQEWFNGYNVEHDESNYMYTANTTPVDIYYSILRNMDTEFNIYAEVDSNNIITVSSPYYYDGDIQSCVSYIDILTYIGNQYFEGFQYVDSDVLIGDSYVTNSNEFSKVYVTHTSNVKQAVNASAYEPASIFNVTVRQVLETIANMFSLKFRYKDGVLWAMTDIQLRDLDLNSDVSIDLLSMNEKFSRGKNNFKYTTDQFPERQKLGYDKYESNFFAEATIKYDKNEAFQSEKADEFIKIGAVIDLYGIALAPDNFPTDSMTVLQLDPDSATNELVIESRNNSRSFYSSFEASKATYPIETKGKSNHFEIVFREESTPENVGDFNALGVDGVIISADNFIVNNGDRVLLSFLCTDILFDADIRLSNSRTDLLYSNHFRFPEIYIGDANQVENGKPKAISNSFYIEQYRLTEYHTNDKKNLYIDGYVKLEFTATALSNNAVIVFVARQGNFAILDVFGTENLPVTSERTIVSNIMTYLIQDTDLPNWDLRPSNMLRTYHTANMYFGKGYLFSNNQDDNGSLSAYSTKKIRQGIDFTIPVSNIKDFNLSGGVISEIGADGEIKDAVYDFQTNNLTVTAVYDKTIIGGNDVIAFSFFKQVGFSVIDYDNKIVTATMGRDGSISDVTFQTWEFSYKATAYPNESNFIEPYKLVVTSATGEIALWTIIIKQEYLLSVNINRRSTALAVDVFRIDTSDASTGVIHTNIGTSFVINGNTLNYNACVGFVNYSIGDPTKVTGLQFESSQTTLDLTMFPNLESLAITSFSPVYSPDISLDEDIKLGNIEFNGQSFDLLFLDDMNLSGLDNFGVNRGADISARYNNFEPESLNVFLENIALSESLGVNVDVAQNSKASQRPHKTIENIPSWALLGLQDTFVGDEYVTQDGRNITYQITEMSGSDPSKWVLKDRGNDEVWLNGGLPLDIANVFKFNGTTDRIESVRELSIDRYDTLEFRCRWADKGSSASQYIGKLDYWLGNPSSKSFYLGVYLDKLVFGQGTSMANSHDYDYKFHKYKIYNYKLYEDDALIYDLTGSNFQTDSAYGFNFGCASNPYIFHSEIEYCYFKHKRGSGLGLSDVYYPRYDGLGGTAGLEKWTENSVTYSEIFLEGGGTVSNSDLVVKNSNGSEIYALMSTPLNTIVSLGGHVDVELF